MAATIGSSRVARPERVSEGRGEQPATQYLCPLKIRSCRWHAAV